MYPTLMEGTRDITLTNSVCFPKKIKIAVERATRQKAAHFNMTEGDFFMAGCKKGEVFATLVRQG